jgi:hypothetical protein
VCLLLAVSPTVRIGARWCARGPRRGASPTLNSAVGLGGFVAGWPLLAQLPAARVNEQRIEQRLRVVLAQEAWRRWPLAGPCRVEALLVLSVLVAPLGAPRVAALAFVQPHVAAAAGGADASATAPNRHVEMTLTSD